MLQRQIFKFILAAWVISAFGFPFPGNAEEPSGITLRPLTIHPLLKIKYGFDSNVFRRGSQALPGYAEPLTRVSSTFIDLIPELGLESKLWNWSLIFNLRVHLTYFQDQEANRQSTTSYPDFLGNHLIKWKSPGQGFNFELEEKWRLTSDPIIQDIPYPLGGERVKRFYNQLAGGLDYTSRSGFFIGKLRYGWERNQYNNSLLKQMNYGVQNLTLRGEDRFLPKTAVSLSVRYRNANWDSPDFGRERNYDSLNLSGWFNGQVTEKLGAIVSLGFEGIRFREGNYSGEPVGTFELIYKPLVTSNINLRYQRSVNPSITSRNYITNIFEFLTEFRDLRPRGLELNLGLEFDLDQYAGLEDRDVKIYHGRVGVFYQLGGALDWLKLGTEYAGEFSRCNGLDYQPYYEYNDHQISFLVNASY